MIPISLYFHIPFCVHRCGYCDFNTYAGLDQLIPSYVDALCNEISWKKDAFEQSLQVQTIFFGGGTPSLLSPSQFEKIFDRIQNTFSIARDVEISLEANPGTVSINYLKALKSVAFNRISLGMQTAQPEELRLLERQHDFPDVIKAVAWSRKAGFDNLNLDLIFGLPGQSLSSWQKSLKLALSLEPEHFALYALSIEHGTPFDHLNRRGLLLLIDPDLAAEMYEWASIILEENNYAQYEISNWAMRKPDEPISITSNPQFACKHNLQYWHNLPYLGFGAGAHGYLNGIRTANVLSPKAFIQRMNNLTDSSDNLQKPVFPRTPATATTQPIDKTAEIGETLMMGLRLTREGVAEETFQDRFHQSLLETFRPEITRLEKIKLLEWVQSGKSHLRLTNYGRLLGNQVFLEFI